MQTNNVQFKRWTPEEEQQLLKEIAESKPIYIIARNHDRSKKAIEFRLLDIAIKMLSDGATYEDIEQVTKCTESQINERINTIEEEKNNKLKSTSSNFPVSNVSNNTNTILYELKKQVEHLNNQFNELKNSLNK